MRLGRSYGDRRNQSYLLGSLSTAFTSMTVDYEQLAQESALFPWLDSDCMGDPLNEDFFDDANLFDELDEE